MRRLTREQWNLLDYQYGVTPPPGDAAVASGQHIVLTSVLNTLGFYPSGRDEAFRLAGELLAHGPETDVEMPEINT